MALNKYFSQIPVSQLEVDPSLDAQRIFQRQWVNKLKKEYDADLLMTITVSLRKDRKYIILDGQHRKKTAEEVEGPDFLMDCIIYTDLTVEQEARLFLAANRDRKPVKPFDNFRVAVTAGDRLALQVKQEVNSVGLEIASGTSANRVGAVQALLAIGRKREGLITRVLTLAEGAWGRETPTWDNMILRSLGIVLSTGSNWDIADDKRLIKTLQKASVAKWKQTATSQTISGGGSNSRSQPLARTVVNEYNSGRLPLPKHLTLPRSVTDLPVEE